MKETSPNPRTRRSSPPPPHTNAAAVGAALLLIIITSACWSTSLATEGGPLPLDRPDDVETVAYRAPDGSLVQPAGPDPLAPSNAALGPVAEPPPIRGTWAPSVPITAVGANAGPYDALSLVDNGDQETVRALFAFPAGIDAADAIADARLEVAGRVVIEGDPDDGQSVRQLVENLGGSLDVEIRPTGLWFWLSIRAESFEQVLPVLAGAFAGETVSSASVRTAARDAIHDIATARRRDPVRFLYNRALEGRLFGVEQQISALRDLSAVEVELTVDQVIRPGAMRLGIAASPLAFKRGVPQLLEQHMRVWLASIAGNAAPRVPGPAALEGLIYARPGSGTDAVVLSVPVFPVGTGNFGVAAMLTTVEWLVGADGNSLLHAELNARIPNLPPWSPRIVNHNGASWLVVHLALPATDAPAVQEAWDATLATAKRSALGPASEARVRASYRANLRLLDKISSSDGQLRDALADWRMLRPQSPLDTNTLILAALAQPGRLPIADAVEALSSFPVSVLAIAGAPESPRLNELPSSFDDASELDGVRIRPGTEIIRATAKVRGRAATDLLRKAFEAHGGFHEVRSFNAFHDRATTRTGRGPTMTEERWLGHDGRFRRVRVVLQTRIETVVDANGRGVDYISGERFPLEPDDVASIRAELDRHPLRLLASMARSTEAELAEWRLIAQREEGGRRLLIIERRDEDGETWTRVGLDASSKLLRRIETRSLNPETGGLVDTREDFRDWRASPGVRAPFYRSTFVEPTRGRTTVWDLFEATVPDDADLQAPEGGD